MKFKRFCKGIVAAAALTALIFALAACNGGNQPAPSPMPGVTGAPTMPPAGGGPENGSPSPTQDSGLPHTTPVPGNPDAAVKFTPGTYTAKAKGMNGDVTVEVSFSDSAIVTVQVKDHKETQGIYEKPVEQIPQEIIGKQRLDVETVSGATYTSDAILEAVADCVTQAGADPSVLGAKTTASPSPNGNGGPSASPDTSPAP